MIIALSKRQKNTMSDNIKMYFGLAFYRSGVSNHFKH